MNPTDPETGDPAPEPAGAPGRGLAQRTVGGFAWVVMAHGGQMVLQLVVLAILARLLTPADFGVVAAALVVINISTYVGELGLRHALVQRLELRAAHVRVALTLSVLLGGAIWALVWATSPLLSSLFNLPELSAVLPVLAASFFIRMLTVGDVLLQRDLRLRQLSIIEVASYALGYGVVAVTLALRGWGVWAMVIGHIGYAATRTLILWFYRPHPWRPSLERGPLVQLVTFGGGRTLAEMAEFVAVQGPNVVVSRWLGATALGFYGRAYQLMSMPSQVLSWAMQKALFPSMASVQTDSARLRSAYTTGIAMIALATLPLSVLAILVSPELILVLLGSNWMPLRSALDILLIGMLFRASYTVSDGLVLAKGAVYRQANRRFVYAGLVIAGALVGQNWGLAGVASGILVALTVNFLLMSQLSISLIQMSWREFLAAHTPAAVATVAVTVVAAPVVVALRFAGAPALVMLVAATAAALGAGVLLCRMAPAVRGLASIAELSAEVSGLVDGPVGNLLRRLLGPRYQLQPPGLDVGGRHA